MISSTTFNPNNIVFGNPRACGNDFRINLSYRYENGSVGDLIIPTGIVSCNGLKHNTNMDTKAIVDGYTLPIRFGQEQADKDFVSIVNAVVEHSREHLLKEETKKACKKPALKPNHLDVLEMTPLYYKDKVVEGNDPMLYPKTLERKSKTDNTKTFMTTFYDQKGNQIEDPLTLLEVRCKAQLAVKLDNIYVGLKTYKVQAKVMEANIELLSQQKRLLAPLQPIITTSASMDVDSKEEEEEENEIEDSDEEESEEDDE